MPLTFADIQRITQGRWIAPPQTPADAPIGFSIDTRTLQTDQAFIAIPGDNFDGHAFIEQACNAGASLIISQDATKTSPGTPCLLVPDTVAALQQLAAAHRQTLRHVIAVAGSNGKTTTRHLIHHVLSAKLVGTQSPKSFNNHLGVPLSLLAAKPSDDFTVIEIGTNHPGEIASLAAIAQPDTAVVISIGEEHLEFFHDLKGVAQEECSLFNFMNPAVEEGLALIPADQYLPPEVTPEINSSNLQRVTPDALAQTVNLPGEHNHCNAAFAVAIARHFNLPNDLIAQQLATVTPPELRSDLRTLGQSPNTITLMVDCYNANPSSMAAALQTLTALPAQRHVAILGDMFELGDATDSLHAALGEQVAQLAIDLPIFIGELSASAARACHLPNTQHYPTFTDALPTDIASQLIPSDAVLIKASRGMRLERLIPAIEQHCFD